MPMYSALVCRGHTGRGGFHGHWYLDCSGPLSSHARIPIKIHALIAQILVDEDDKSSAMVFLQVSKAHHDVCSPIVYRDVSLEKFTVHAFAKAVFETHQDNVETKARKLAYRQSVTTIALNELPRIETAHEWESGIKTLVRSDSSGPPIFPNLQEVQLSGIYVQQLALFLEVNTPLGAVKPFPKSHPFTVILRYICRDSEPGQLKITADGNLQWPERYFKSVTQSRMWEVDTEINEPVKRQLSQATIHHAWMRIDEVKNNWAIEEIWRLPGLIESFTPGVEVTLVNR